MRSKPRGRDPDPGPSVFAPVANTGLTEAWQQHLSLASGSLTHRSQHRNVSGDLPSPG